MDELLMHNQNTLPKNCKKYWRQRYSLFSKFDEGVYMNSELWYSVTPEKIALFVAKAVYYYMPKAKHILDICCGGGGNTIQFARYFDKVGAVDLNPTNVFCTMHNCSIYGVKDKVWSETGDWCELKDDEIFLEKCQDVDFIFSSPPWGGPNYTNQEIFNLDNLIPLPLEEMLKSLFKICSNIALFLPRNSDLGQLEDITKKLLGENGKCRIINVDLDGRRKGLVAFWGDEFTNTDYDYIESEDDEYSEDYDSENDEEIYEDESGEEEDYDEEYDKENKYTQHYSKEWIESTIPKDQPLKLEY